jgi:peptidoglycan/LPS O-acetylase OafA/YrhL
VRRLLRFTTSLVGRRSLLPDGFLGVDVLFVLSGYLITGLLRAEYNQRGRIDRFGSCFEFADCPTAQPA